MKKIALVALALLVGIGLYGVRSEDERMTICVPVAERERIREVVLAGIDRALRDHVVKLFDIWMKDDHMQPKRAIEGMSVGISAHVRARANALSWNPPPCGGKP
jgi:hypothetical protein